MTDHDTQDATTEPDDVPAGALSQNPRDIAMREIADRRKVEYAQELAENNATYQAMLGNTPDGDEVDAETEPAEPIKTRAIVVDGQEKVVPETKIMEAGIRTLQKQEAADKRLEDAARVLREAEELMQQAMLHRQELHREDSVVVSAADVGDAVTRAMAQRDAETAAHQKQAEAQQYILDAFPDVWGDPYLRQIAVMRDDELIRAGDNRPMIERAVEVMAQVREWRDGFAGAGKVETTKQVETLSNKHERKVTLPQPVQAAAARQPAPAPQKPRTASDIIDSIRAARNQTGKNL